MRKPRDYDAELKALDDKARRLKDLKLVQLGELVVATGADALPIQILTGALLAAKSNPDANTQEAWRQLGATFFQQKPRVAAQGDSGDRGGAEANERRQKPTATKPGVP